MNSFNRRQLRTFAAQGAAHRAALWAVVVTVGAATTRYTLAKAPATTTRQADELRAGYVQRTLATFLVPAAAGFTPAIGSQFTIQESEVNPAEVATVWRVFEITPGACGEETRCVAFKLD